VRLVQREETFQIVDQREAIVEFYHAWELLEVRHDLIRTDDGGLFDFDHALGLIHHQRHRTSDGRGDHKLVGGPDFPLR